VPIQAGRAAALEQVVLAVASEAHPT